MLLACRAASFIKVIAPKAFPSLSWFNEELQHPLDASHGCRELHVGGNWNGFALCPYSLWGCCHHLQSPALGREGELLPKLLSCILKMQRNSLLPFKHLPLLGCCTGLEPLSSLSLSLRLWVCGQIPSRAGSAAAAQAGINGPCTLQCWWQGQINPLLQNQSSDGSWWVADSPLSLGCPENGHVAQGAPNTCAETEVT